MQRALPREQLKSTLSIAVPDEHCLAALESRWCLIHWTDVRHISVLVGKLLASMVNAATGSKPLHRCFARFGLIAPSFLEIGRICKVGQVVTKGPSPGRSLCTPPARLNMYEDEVEGMRWIIVSPREPGSPHAGTQHVVELH